MNDLKTGLAVPADLLSLRSIGPWLEKSLAEAGDPDPAASLASMELAVQEICVNVVKYAYDDSTSGVIDLECIIDDESCTIVIRDQGVAYDVTTQPEVDLEKPTIGGYGLFLVEALCEQMVYDRVGEGNEWTLRFKRTVQVPS